MGKKFRDVCLVFALLLGPAVSNACVVAFGFDPTYKERTALNLTDVKQIDAFVNSGGSFNNDIVFSIPDCAQSVLAKMVKQTPFIISAELVAYNVPKYSNYCGWDRAKARHTFRWEVKFFDSRIQQMASHAWLTSPSTAVSKSICESVN